MRIRTRAAVAVAATALLAAGCSSDIKEPQDDSVGAYEPAVAPGTAVPTGGPLPGSVDTAQGPAGRDSVGTVVNPPATPASPASPTPRTPPPVR